MLRQLTFKLTASISYIFKISMNNKIINYQLVRLETRTRITLSGTMAMVNKCIWNKSNDAILSRQPTLIIPVIKVAYICRLRYNYDLDNRICGY